MLLEKLYEWKHRKNVVHTTWNPGGPGVVRIHLIPPTFHLFRHAPSVAIINGNYIVPLNEAWSILMTEFIYGINMFGEKEMSDQQMDEIMMDTFYRVRKVYQNVDDEDFYRDLKIMTQTFYELATGKVPKAEIGQMTIGEYAPYMRAPHRMDLMVSSMKKNGEWNCNQKCVHCYAANQPLGEEKEMSTAEWKKIINKCKDAGIVQLTFTGGEPTLRPDLCELIKEAKWFVTRLNTNGILLSDKLCKELREAEVDNIQVTFYSAEEQIHNLLVGGNHYLQTIEGIRNVLKNNLSLNINTPLCSINSEYVATLRFLHDLGVQYVTCSGMIVTGNACLEKSRETRLSEDELYDILNKAVNYCYENEMEISFTSPGWIKQEKLQELGLSVPSCGACLSNMAITPDGYVVPCQSALSGLPLGNLKSQSFNKIWHSKKCREQRNYSAQMKQECPLKVRNLC